MNRFLFQSKGNWSANRHRIRIRCAATREHKNESSPLALRTSLKAFVTSVIRIPFLVNEVIVIDFSSDCAIINEIPSFYFGFFVVVVLFLVHKV